MSVEGGVAGQEEGGGRGGGLGPGWVERVLDEGQQM